MRVVLPVVLLLLLSPLCMLAQREKGGSKVRPRSLAQCPSACVPPAQCDMRDGLCLGTGEIQVTLRWDVVGDMDLYVTDHLL